MATTTTKGTKGQARLTLADFPELVAAREKLEAVREKLAETNERCETLSAQVSGARRNSNVTARAQVLLAADTLDVQAATAPVREFELAREAAAVLAEAERLQAFAVEELTRKCAFKVVESRRGEWREIGLRIRDAAIALRDALSEESAFRDDLEAEGVHVTPQPCLALPRFGSRAEGFDAVDNWLKETRVFLDG